MRADLREPRTHVFDESERRLANVGLVPSFVLLEPLPVVVARELAEKVEQSGAEVRTLCHAAKDTTSVAPARHARYRRRGTRVGRGKLLPWPHQVWRLACPHSSGGW